MKQGHGNGSSSNAGRRRRQKRRTTTPVDTPPSPTEVTAPHEVFTGDEPIKIVLIHGTFAEGAAWTKEDSALWRTLRNAIPEAHIETFSWGGGNSNQVRFRAGFELAAMLSAELLTGVRSRRILICHSHGSHAVIGAIRTLRNFNDLVCGLVFINTPFLEGWVPPRALAERVGSPNLCFVIFMAIVSAFWEVLPFWWTFLTGISIGYAGAIFVAWARASSEESWYWRSTLPVKDAISFPVLAITCKYDEPLLLLGGLSGVQRWIQTIYMSPLSYLLFDSFRVRLPIEIWPLRILAVLSYPIRPLLPLAMTVCGAVLALAYGQRPVRDCMMTFFVTKTTTG